MVFDEAGTYTIEYTATDDCGNTTTSERTVIVEAPPRTVLYTDGTFIINELSRDIDANIQAHGVATNVYDPLDEDHNYVFLGASSRPWDGVKATITSVEIGSKIYPTSTDYWFDGMSACTSIELDNLDTSRVTSMHNMFYTCQSLASLDVSNFSTGLVTDMRGMFGGCQLVDSLDVSNFDTSSVNTMYEMFFACNALTSLDLSSFDTRNVTAMNNMFQSDSNLKTVYVSSDFVVTQVSNSSNMFSGCSRLVGGAGTTYSTSYKDKTRARIDNPPDEKGYFTAKN